MADPFERVLLDCVIRWSRSPPEHGQHHNGPQRTRVEVLRDGVLVGCWHAEPRDHRALHELLSETVTCRADVVELMDTDAATSSRIPE